MCLGVPGKIESVAGHDDVTRTGKVNFGGVMKHVHLGYVPEATVGDYVIVHAGFALSVLDEDEARRTLEYLSQLEPVGDVDTGLGPDG